MHFPRSCLHCETPACVTVCPTGASYKRAEDGIVLVNADTCIGCKLCSWACPYGAREYDDDDGVMKKCTLCVDRIYNDDILDRKTACRPASRLPAARGISAISAIPNSTVSQLVAERGGFDLMPEMGYRPVNKYLPPRPKTSCASASDDTISLIDLATKRRATDAIAVQTGRPRPRRSDSKGSAFLRWADRVLSR